MHVRWQSEEPCIKQKQNNKRSSKSKGKSQFMILILALQKKQILDSETVERSANDQTNGIGNVFIISPDNHQEQIIIIGWFNFCTSQDLSVAVLNCWQIGRAVMLVSANARCDQYVNL